MGKRNVTGQSQAQLVFPETSAKVGKPYTMSAHADARSDTAVRELVQNALDAHTEINKSKEYTCNVTFKTGRLLTKEIPGFEKYQKALRAAILSWEGKNPSVIKYLKTIKEYADQDEIDVLYVIDNGKGLDSGSIDAVLAEGSPKKRGGSTGSFGVGHFTTFGLSGLNYIFYGGKQKDGTILGAGHSILASYKGTRGELRSEHGYFVKEFSSMFDSLYKFCDSRDLPKFLLSELKKIQGSGSVIAILGFNWFKLDADDKEENEIQLNNLILEVVAKNFAVAVCEKQLEITVSEKIDETKILEFLERKVLNDQDEEAIATLEAVKTLKDGTLLGKLSEDKYSDCEIVQRNGTSHHNVSIWRNGMLITRKHRGLSRRWFGGQEMLNAIILLSGSKNPRKAHDLVKGAESPMHNEILEKWLDNKQEREELKNLLASIRRWITDHAEKIGEDSTDLHDEILIGSGVTGDFKNSRPSKKSVDDDEADPGVRGDEQKEEEKKKEEPLGKDRPVKRAITRGKITEARVQGKFQTDGKYRIKLIPNKNLDKAIIQLIVDNGVDPSCVGNIVERELEISTAVDSNGTELSIYEGNVRIEGLQKDKPVDITVTFNPPPVSAGEVSLDCLLGSAD